VVKGNGVYKDKGKCTDSRGLQGVVKRGVVNTDKEKLYLKQGLTGRGKWWRGGIQICCYWYISLYLYSREVYQYQIICIPPPPPFTPPCSPLLLVHFSLSVFTTPRFTTPHTPCNDPPPTLHPQQPSPGVYFWDVPPVFHLYPA